MPPVAKPARPWTLLGQTVSHWASDDISTHAAALAYFTVFAIAPTLIFAVAIAGLAFGPEAARGELQGELRSLVGDAGAKVIEDMMANAARPVQGPEVRVQWRDVWIGAAVTALLFNLGKLGIGLYLGRSAVASSYGAAGSLAVLLLWVYCSAQVLFLGAEFTHVYAHARGRPPAPRARGESLPAGAKAAH